MKSQLSFAILKLCSCYNLFSFFSITHRLGSFTQATRMCLCVCACARVYLCKREILRRNQCQNVLFSERVKKPFPIFVQDLLSVPTLVKGRLLHIEIRKRGKIPQKIKDYYSLLSFYCQLYQAFQNISKKNAFVIDGSYFYH